MNIVRVDQIASAFNVWTDCQKYLLVHSTKNLTYLNEAKRFKVSVLIDSKHNFIDWLINLNNLDGRFFIQWELSNINELHTLKVLRPEIDLHVIPI